MDKDVEVVIMIKTTLSTRGNGTEEDPIRRITEYWNTDGECIARFDPKDTIIVH